MASTSPTARGGLVLSSIVAILTALYYCLGAFVFGQAPKTFCYRDGIRTGSQDVHIAQCFQVKDGLFTEVTPSSEAVKAAQLLPGHAIPGLWDGHGHLLQYGEFLHSVNLFGAESFDEVNRRILAYIDAHPGAGSSNSWIRGVGWDQMALGGMPAADFFDKEGKLKGLFIMVDRVDVHCSWVSRAVLDLLPADTPTEVPGGEIIKDPGPGVFCDNAIDLVTALWPRPGPDARRRFIRSAMQNLHTVGIVGIHDAGATPTDLAIFRSMAEDTDAQGWTMRVYAMLECEERNTVCLDTAAGMRRTPDTGGDDMLTIRSVKLFADGALGSWGSAMLEPYNDRPDTSGSLLVNASTLERVAREWAVADWQWRMRRLGIIPSIQPTHATSDMKYAELRLGEERTEHSAYRMSSFLAIGPIILGSDFPVEPADPFQGIYAAVARRSPHTGRGADGSDKPWYPEEALTPDQALAGFTTGPAYGAFLEGRAGVIQKGALADWVVLDKPLEDYGIDELRTLKVKETWVGGRRVYSRGGDEVPEEKDEL
ncbi:amidohydrolase [Magnaporthiopsis poae ATCC 64411]|uniref:Amidohydrolase n=1 Tax=Magnaporthiopsis poae (strain ATCC 64411 / 73-15) TaxID=644358 RepID=A0A0C4EE78_MAGP6|nr:amidohydrolase [Magnaporthiopsis poae ATCC 64411]